MNTKLLLALTLAMSCAAVKTQDKQTPKVVRMQALAGASFNEIFAQLTPQQKAMCRYALELLDKASDQALEKLSATLAAFGFIVGKFDQNNVVGHYIQQVMQQTIQSNAGDNKKVLAIFREHIKSLLHQVKEYFDTLPGMIVVESTPVKKGLVERMTSSVKNVFTR